VLAGVTEPKNRANRIAARARAADSRRGDPDPCRSGRRNANRAAARVSAVEPRSGGTDPGRGDCRTGNRATARVGASNPRRGGRDACRSDHRTGNRERRFGNPGAWGWCVQNPRKPDAESSAVIDMCLFWTNVWARRAQHSRARGLNRRRIANCQHESRHLALLARFFCRHAGHDVTILRMRRYLVCKPVTPHIMTEHVIS
jgi:hypothetical protein